MKKRLYSVICIAVMLCNIFGSMCVASATEDIVKYNYKIGIDDIKDYIDNHYNENDISTASVAEKFGITSQYLSTIFKKATGENLYGYITKLRIEKAKKLMNNKNLTIVQIAEKVGYTSDISFIRAFKKTEGITPGKYREGENDE